MKSATKPAERPTSGHASVHPATASPRTRSRGPAITPGAPIRPPKRRGRSRRDASLEQRIDDLASRKSEFEANLRKPAGLLDAFFELVGLMASDSPTSSAGLTAASPRRP
jgi:hypothetical protein